MNHCKGFQLPAPVFCQLPSSACVTLTAPLAWKGVPTREGPTVMILPNSTRSLPPPVFVCNRPIALPSIAFSLPPLDHPPSMTPPTPEPHTLYAYHPVAG